MLHLLSNREVWASLRALSRCSLWMSTVPTSNKMREVIVLDDDDDVVPAPMEQSQPASQSGGLTDEQRTRMAQQKELALARRLNKENWLASQSEPRILDTSTFPTAVVGYNNKLSTRETAGGQGHGHVISSPYFAGNAGGGLKRNHEDADAEANGNDGDDQGWRSVRKLPMPGQSFGRELTDPFGQFAHGQTTTSTDRLQEAERKDVQSNEDEGRAGFSLNANPLSTPNQTEKPNSESQPPRPKVKAKPSPQQMKVLMAIRDGKSVFMTGSAGTGKSFVLEYAIRLLKMIHGGDGVYVTASTGLAAVALGGTTLHSFAGVGIGKGTKKELLAKAKGRREVRNRWLYAKALIIDEISMIDGEFLDKLDYVGQNLRGNSKPFGGIQLIVTGDFYQLPPVNPPNPDKFFAFEADCWDKCFHLQIELQTVFRQSDETFVGMLNELRRGHCSDSIRQRLQMCSGPVRDDCGIIPTRLYPLKVDVGRENDQNLRSLGQPTVIFKAMDVAQNDFAKRQLENVRVVPVISLSLGAQVMLAKNLDTTLGLVNGARGVVVGFLTPDDPRSAQLDKSHRPVNPNFMWPIVKFAGGLERVIGPESWSIMEGEVEVAKRTQVPLLLAWALSVHKCQGMTLDRVETDLSRAFDYGMVYVALSRVKSLDGLQLIGFDPSKIKVHKKVALFYDKLQSKGVSMSTSTNSEESSRAIVIDS